jgi:hypothetical protein
MRDNYQLDWLYDLTYLTDVNGRSLLLNFQIRFLSARRQAAACDHGLAQQGAIHEQPKQDLR